MENYQKNSIPKVQTDVKEALFLKRAELTRELKELDAIISRVQQEYSLRLEQLLVQKKPLEDALYHVEALLMFEGLSTKDSSNIGHVSTTPAVIARTSITDAAFNLLEELHQPMHYKGIAAQLQERNAYIPGKNPAATLLTRMSRDNRFKHTKKRGMYVLSTWRVRTTRDEPPHKEAILLPQPWELHIRRLQDLVATDKVKNQFSLFALGIHYGRG
jgi:hypothetical protein